MYKLERNFYDRDARIVGEDLIGKVLVRKYGNTIIKARITETEGIGTCSAVLIRSVEPAENIEEMCLNRYNKPLNEITKYQLNNMCNGPGKLCKALKITKEENGKDLIGDEIFAEDDGFKSFKVGKTKRINIDYAEEAKDFLWRYSIKK